MPYVDKEARERLLGGTRPQSVGELNYIITETILDYLPAKPSYADYNGVVGVLESAKLEFYRRAVAPYENQKAFDNGDVYQPPIGLVMEGNTSDG